MYPTTKSLHMKHKIKPRKIKIQDTGVAVWPSGNNNGHINKVNLCCAQLVVRWVTIRR